MTSNAALQKETWTCGVRCNPSAQYNPTQHTWDRVVSLGIAGLSTL